MANSRLARAEFLTFSTVKSQKSSEVKNHQKLVRMMMSILRLDIILSSFEVSAIKSAPFVTMKSKSSSFEEDISSTLISMYNRRGN
jgi:LysM repeat protein